MLSAFYHDEPTYFRQNSPLATLLHFVSQPHEKVMVGRISFSEDGTQVLGTTLGKRISRHPLLDAMWIEQWIEAQQLLGLHIEWPGPPRASMATIGYFTGVLWPSGLVFKCESWTSFCCSGTCRLF
jgi:hypothetical protein